MSRTKKICLISILVACASILSIIDRYVSSIVIPTLPGVKIGLANIVILIAIINLDFKDCLIITILKSIIGGLLVFGFTSFIIGGSASLISFLLMYLIKLLLKDKISIIGISIIGGISHILTQLFVISIMYQMGSVVYMYGAWLLLVSFVSSIVIGIVAISVNKALENNILKRE